MSLHLLQLVPSATRVSVPLCCVVDHDDMNQLLTVIHAHALAQTPDTLTDYNYGALPSLLHHGEMATLLAARNCTKQVDSQGDECYVMGTTNDNVKILFY